MEIKYQKPKYVLLLVSFGLLLLFGVVSSLIWYDVNPGLVIISIAFGAIGTLFGLIMLLYGLLYIYEANFDNKGISVAKRRNEVFINFGG